jgi:FkbM family methyltransferase
MLYILIKILFRCLGLKILKNNTYLKMRLELSSIPKFVNLWNYLDDNQRKEISPYLNLSVSQFSQDLFVISELHKRTIPAYFVEFGAASGHQLSNTYLLEKYFNWNGILSEPAKVWHEKLRNNRSCIIDTRCVYSVTGKQIEFFETKSLKDDLKKSGPELSSLKIFHDSGDWATKVRINHSLKYLVESVSLNDLLSHHGAPFHIGYLSIDTEGGEFEILKSLNFDKYKIEIISVEHNGNINNRKSIFNLLHSKNYLRVFENSFGPDDIYVLNNRI